MATIVRAGERRFEEVPGKIDGFRLFSDTARARKGIAPQHLHVDLRQLNPGEYSAPYHFHRYAEEMFYMISGRATLRTPDGLETVGPGDLLFFEMGETGAHQLHNNTKEPCTYLDVRSSIGYDVCEYPDSDKVLLAPSFEVFRRGGQASYFDGEENIRAVWERLRSEK